MRVPCSDAGASCAGTRRHIKQSQALDTVVDPGNAPSVHTRSGVDMAGIRVAGLSGQVAQSIEGRRLYQLTVGRINKLYGVPPYIVEPALHLIERLIDLRGGCLRCLICSRSAGDTLQVAPAVPGALLTGVELGVGMGLTGSLLVDGGNEGVA